MMSKKVVEWSDLPEELIDVIGNRLFSNVEILRFRSICKSWRYAIAINKRFLNRRNHNRRSFLSPYNNRKQCLVSPATFFRVILSSCPNKGWLIKTLDVSVFHKKLLCPLSSLPMDFPDKTLDLLKFTVSETHRSYEVHYLEKSYGSSYHHFARVVLVDNLVLVVDKYKKIWWHNCGDISNRVWTRILDEEVEHFVDIIVHKDLIYALDFKGAIWWIRLSDLNIYQFGPSTPMNYYEFDDCKEKRLVEYCGDLCVIHRFCKSFCAKGAHIERTVGFKVYKMDEEIVEWFEVKCLGDKAFMMTTDSCFAVLAREYYGCLENSIYFIDEEEEDIVKVFKLGDRSIIKTVKSSSGERCFEIFSPPFV